MHTLKSRSGDQLCREWDEKLEGISGLHKLPDYLEADSPDEMRAALLRDPALPAGLHATLMDDDFWAAFQPTAFEIRAFVRRFGMYSHGSRNTFVSAFRLIRLFLTAAN